MPRRWCVAAAALAVVAGPVPAASASPASPVPALSRGAPASALHPGDPMLRPAGPALAGPRGAAGSEIRSSNWSGYAVSGSAGAYRSVSADWTQPAVACSSGDTFVTFWVGLDGYGSHSVEQAGTGSDCIGRTARYSAWYQMYPAPPVYFRGKVKPGDRMSASVTFSGAGTYRLVLRDRSRGWTRTVTRHETGLDRSSAEVITEAPSSRRGVLRLADFGTVLFTAARANGTLLRNRDPTKIVMSGSGGLGKDSTGPLSSAGAFRNTWVRSN